MAATKLKFKAGSPRNVLMIKAHTAGVGDLVRGSAAWRGLRDLYPDSRRHLWFLTTRPGTASEKLIASHHLIDSFQASVKGKEGLKGWRRLFREGSAIADRTRPDLVIDFEPHGLRTSILAWWVGLRAKAPTVGIAQVPLRRAFYTVAAPGMRRYAELRGLPFPIEYTERDFVALAALGIERNGMPIEMRECEVARTFRERLLAQTGTARPLLGLNIGCGLAGSTHRRPDMELIARLTRELVQRHGFDLVMTGATFESEINEEFLRRFPMPAKVTNLAGKTSIRELTGAIAACRMLISGDSGPYHMGVALRIPTLALFNFPNPVHYHHHPWIQCLVAPTVAAFPEAMAAAERLFALPFPAIV